MRLVHIQHGAFSALPKVLVHQANRIEGAVIDHLDTVSIDHLHLVFVSFALLLLAVVIVRGFSLCARDLLFATGDGSILRIS